MLGFRWLYWIEHRLLGTSIGVLFLKIVVTALVLYIIVTLFKKSIGRIYLQAVVETYGSVAIGKLLSMSKHPNGVYEITVNILLTS